MKDKRNHVYLHSKQKGVKEKLILPGDRIYLQRAFSDLHDQSANSVLVQLHR